MGGQSKTPIVPSIIYGRAQQSHGSVEVRTVGGSEVLEVEAHGVQVVEDSPAPRVGQGLKKASRHATQPLLQFCQARQSNNGFPTAFRRWWSVQQFKRTGEWIRDLNRNVIVVSGVVELRNALDNLFDWALFKQSTCDER